MSDCDTEVVAKDSQLYKHLVSYGIENFEVSEKISNQSQPPKEPKTKKFNFRSLLYVFVPQKKFDYKLVEDILNSQLLLEEDIIFIESCLPTKRNKSLIKKLLYPAIIAVPVFILSSFSRKHVASLSLAICGVCAVRKCVSYVNHYLDRKSILLLIKTLKQFTFISRKCQALIQEWEVVASSLTLLRDTTALNAKMCGVDELKSCLINVIRQEIITLSKYTRDIVLVYTGTDVHTLCMEIMDSQIMCQQDITMANIKKLHYIFMLVQSDFLKNVALCFTPSSSSLTSAQLTGRVNIIKQYNQKVIEAMNELIEIITKKYNSVKCYRPRNDTASVTTRYGKTCGFDDVRISISNIAVCLEALTMQSLETRDLVEQPLNSTKDKINLLNKLQDRLLNLQTDLYSTQKSIEIAVKQTIKIKGEGQIGRMTDKNVISRPLESCSDISHARVKCCSSTEVPPQDEVYELYVRSGDNESDNETRSGRPSLQEEIQGRVEREASRRFLNELKSALVSKQQEMSVREQNAVEKRKLMLKNKVRKQLTLKTEDTTSTIDSGVDVNLTKGISHTSMLSDSSMSSTNSSSYIDHFLSLTNFKPNLPIINKIPNSISKYCSLLNAEESCSKQIENPSRLYFPKLHSIDEISNEGIEKNRKNERIKELEMLNDEYCEKSMNVCRGSRKNGTKLSKHNNENTLSKPKKYYKSKEMVQNRQNKSSRNKNQNSYNVTYTDSSCVSSENESSDEKIVNVGENTNDLTSSNAASPERAGHVTSSIGINKVRSDITNVSPIHSDYQSNREVYGIDMETEAHLDSFAPLVVESATMAGGEHRLESSVDLNTLETNDNCKTEMTANLSSVSDFSKNVPVSQPKDQLIKETDMVNSKQDSELKLNLNRETKNYENTGSEDHTKEIRKRITKPKKSKNSHDDSDDNYEDFIPSVGRGIPNVKYNRIRRHKTYPSNHRRKYQYEPDPLNNDPEVKPYKNLNVAQEAVMKAIDMKLVVKEECFGSDS